MAILIRRIIPKLLLLSIIVLIMISIYLTYSEFIWSKREAVVKICNAGSLTIPLQKIATRFRQRYGIDVILEPSGSVEAIRKVTDLGKVCDIVAVADYRLIPKFMIPKYSKWYIAFASNSIVIAYTNKSKYADEVRKNPLNIFEILGKPDVRYGLSDPNRDPCGYRAIGVIALASLYMHNLSIVSNLVISNIPDSKLVKENNTLHIYIPPIVEAKGNLVVRPKSVDLIALLEGGAIDYAFEYRSVAIQHHLNYVELPPQLSLNDPKYDYFYSRVVIHILAGTRNEKTIRMGPIIYGITIPSTAKNLQGALLFLKFLLSDEGREVFESLGQAFLSKPTGFGEVPQELRSYVVLSED